MNFTDMFLATTAAGTKSTCLYYTASGTFTAPIDMEIVLHAIGGGGSGGLAYGGNTQAQASGGGGGGYAKKKVKLAAGTVLTLTVGAGGAFRSSVAGATGSLAGLDGGNTTIVGTGISLAGNGGKGGAASYHTSYASVATAGGAGGTASGGDTNFAGGRGGNINAILPTGSSGPFRVTGGGAVNLFGINDCNGGDIATPSFAGTTYTSIVSGGGGIAGSGEINENISDARTAGGGTRLLGINAGNNTSTLPGGWGLLGYYLTVGPEGAGHIGGVTPVPAPGNGAGSGGTNIISTGVNSSADARPGGVFAGGGGASCRNTSYDAQGGSGGANGGGGGGAGHARNTGTGGRSGGGGGGLVVLEILS